jgi:hypothetical protein
LENLELDAEAPVVVVVVMSRAARVEEAVFRGADRG